MTNLSKINFSDIEGFKYKQVFSVFASDLKLVQTSIKLSLIGTISGIRMI